MAGGMARYIDHLKLQSQQMQAVAVSHGCGGLRNGFTRGAEDLGASGVAQHINTSNMVGVVVRD